MVLVIEIPGLQNANTNEYFQTEDYLITKHFPWSSIACLLLYYCYPAIHNVLFTEQNCTIENRWKYLLVCKYCLVSFVNINSKKVYHINPYILPLMLYGAHVWINALKHKANIIKYTRVQRCTLKLQKLSAQLQAKLYGLTLSY